MTRWRTGRKIELNVYNGDKPMFQCHSRRDAKRTVRLLNWGERWVEVIAAPRTGCAHRSRRVSQAQGRCRRVPKERPMTAPLDKTAAALAITDILRGIPPAERRDVLYAVERLLEAEDRMPNILTGIREGE